MNYFASTYAGNIFRFTRKMAEEGNTEAEKVHEIVKTWIELSEKENISCSEIREIPKRAKKIKDYPSWGQAVYELIKGQHYDDCILPRQLTSIAYDFPVRTTNQIYLLMEPVEETFELRGHNKYARISILLEPFLDKKHFAIEWKLSEKKLPKRFLKYVFRGIRKASFEEFDEDKQVFHVKVSIIDAYFHEIDSHEGEYQKAAYFAYKKALDNAKLERL